jgi:hypothetical protein
MAPTKADEASQIRMAIIEEQMIKLEFLMKKIDRDIGYNFWKKYVASAFWSQISTPINLIITFLTATTTAQAQSPDLLPQNIYSQVAIVSLVITTLNTFFRPHTQFTTNSEFLQKWSDIGVRFEKEYYDKVIVKFYTEEEIQNVKKKILNYEKIQEDMNIIRKSEGSSTVNFITDLLFVICYSTCIRKYKRWLDHDQKIAKDTEEVTTERKKKEAQQMSERRKNEVDIFLDKERVRSYARVGMAQIELHEQQEMAEISKERAKCEIAESMPYRNVSNQNTLQMFDLFLPTPNVSPPASPPPPPPPNPPAEPPPNMSISNIIEVKKE